MPIWKGKTYFICAAQKKIFHVFDLVAFASCTTTKRPFGSAFAVSKYREEATTAEKECWCHFLCFYEYIKAVGIVILELLAKNIVARF